MRKRMLIMLICLGILFGAILAWKIFGKIMVKRMLAANESPIVTVTTTTTTLSPWQSTLDAVGNTRAIKGVNITTELAGLVQSIYFQPGSTVKAGQTLVQLNADSDNALLLALQANAELGKITYERDKKQYAVHAVSEQTLDSDFQNMHNLTALADQQKATVLKKTIKAPFGGRLGISAINLGQYLNPGDKVVTLQALNPIYVDFSVPQQVLSLIKVDMPVNVTTDVFPGEMFKGKITTVDPLIDVNTRNVQVEATVDNPKAELIPGMFTMVSINSGKAESVITLPQTAISFNPYGDIVYVATEDKNKKEAKDQKKDKDKDKVLIVKQVFVKTGATRGEQIQILQGLQAGQIVVTSGQLKLKNGSRITINNSVTLPDQAATNLPNDH